MTEDFVEYKVTIEMPGERRVEFVSDELGMAIGEAILMMRTARNCQVVADVIYSVWPEGEETDKVEFWPGYGKEVQRMIDSAQFIHDGWTKLEEQREKS